MRNRVVVLVGLVVLAAALPLLAQTNTQSVRLFQSYFFDSPIAKAPYGQAGLVYSDYEGGSIFSVGPQGGFPINDKIEVEGALSYVSSSPEHGDGQSGISDLEVYGRYNLANSKQFNGSVGAMVTLPIGSEDIGAGNLNFGGFGALRYALQNGMVITGTLGLIFYETTTYDVDLQTGRVEEKTSHENYLNLGAGAIYPLSGLLHLVGELVMHTEGDYMLLSAGADYKVGNGRLRGALGIGLDDGAPDLQLMAGYAISF
ncbi:MAG: hypothetical protein H5U38_11785 [Calditrichaeota bacterium]|nr:hypothetical protein [Calditrichota bacterium]